MTRRAAVGESAMKYRILIEQDEDGCFVATCPALPGCISQGKTQSEARLLTLRKVKQLLSVVQADWQTRLSEETMEPW